MAQPDLSFAAGKADEVGRPLEPAVQARRGHFEAAVIDPLDLQYPLQLPAYRLAIGHGDAARDGAGGYFMLFLNKHAECPAVIYIFKIGQLESQAAHRALEHGLKRAPY